MAHRVEPERYRQLDLRAHEFLSDVPLHDVWHVDLPGGGRGRTVSDVRAMMSMDRLSRINVVVRALFSLRGLLGRLFGWDDETSSVIDESGSYRSRLSDDDRARSAEAPGASDGSFKAVYVFPNEALSEIRNRTVHAFLLLALFEDAGGGHDLYWAVYVAPVGRITGFYMALIDPFRRFLVYPAILRHLQREWTSTYGEARGAIP